MNALARAAALVVAGLLQAASIALPWSGQPGGLLQLVSLAALVALIDPLRASRNGGAWRSALWQGWVFTTAWLCGSFWWLFISMNTYGGLPAPFAAFAVLALAAALASYYAVACAVYVRFASTRPVRAALLFAAVWTLAELMRGSWFTGFPWGAGGYAHTDSVLAGYAPWAGVYGIGAVAALVAACVAPAATAMLRRHGDQRPPTRAVVAPVAVAVLALAAPLAWQAVHGGDFTRSAGKLDVALLQGNIAQDEKFVPNGGVAVALQWYGEQLRDARASLVVTPETALPMLPQQLPPGYLQAIAQRYGQGGQAAMVGLPFVDEQRRYYNRLFGFQPGAPVYSYDKHHLVPFGEFIPSGFRWFVDAMNIPLGDFGRGGLAQPVFGWKGQRIAPNICYEDLFGDEIGAGFRSAATAPTILLNVSNIAWFGDTVAINEHLAISRMRALEFQRPMARATNTGATATIDHTGRVMYMLPRLTRGVLEAPVEGREGLTPFAWWVSRFGLWPLWIGGLAVVALAVIGARRRR